MKISAKILQETLLRHFKIKNEKRTSILLNSAIFKDFDKSTLTSLYMYSWTTFLQKGKLVITQGALNRHIYFIVEGEVEFLCKVEAKEQEFHNVASREFFGLMKSQKKVKYCSLLKMRKGDYFGDENGFVKSEVKYTVRVVSNKC